jgi:hypothetical protein
MFDGLVEAARAGGVAEWARVENAACARRLAAIADILERCRAADGSAEREQWCIDNWDAVCADVAAAQNVSLGVASHQLLVAMALRERLPRVAEVFNAGTIGLRMVNTIVYRTGLITDADARGKVDTEIAAACAEWGALSVAKLESAIDYWVDRCDPYALRRTETQARGRHVDITTGEDGAGLASVEAILFVHDAEALDQRLDAMANGVCERDPRTLEQRRSDALGALGQKADRLVCRCGDTECEGAGRQPSAVVVHVIAEEQSLNDDTVLQLDGKATQSVWAPRVPQRPSKAPPAKIIGGGMLPAPLLAATLASTAKLVPIVHPGDAPPEPRYTPSAALAAFIRCRDLTCRAPGCDVPATECDIDHTIPYPAGPTQASNLKCLCRKHHLIKTFLGWQDRQLPDGTVIWTAPNGKTYVTHPGSRLLFPSLCAPTAPVAAPPDTSSTPHRTLQMPRRTLTREQARAQRIRAERQRNNDYVVERNRPPPF